MRAMHSMRSARYAFGAACFGLLMATGCQLAIEQELLIRWTIDGDDSASLCTDYQIATWRVEAEGPNLVSATIDCELDRWQALRVVEEGSYDITVTARDAGGQLVGSRVLRGVFVDGDERSPIDIPITFTASDFAGVGNAKIEVFWNINGTVDGSAQGRSWDSCEEVGAAKVSISVGQQKTIHDCSKSGNMSAVITGLSEQQTYRVSVALLDEHEKEITTVATDDIIASQTGGRYTVDFFYDSFLEPIRSGTSGRFLFETTYQGGQTCAGVSPAVDLQLTLLTQGGTTISAQVCNLDRVACQDTDDGTFDDFSIARTCSDGQQELTPLTWGMYKLRLRGAVDVGGGFDPDLCWDSGEVDVLVGAGDDNPLMAIDPARAASCSQ